MVAETIAHTRILPSMYGKWVLGPHFTSLVTKRQLTNEGSIKPAILRFIKNKISSTPLEIPHLFYLTVMTTTECNLGCAYCFQNTSLNLTNPFRPNRIPKSFLTPRVVDSIIDFVSEKMQAENLHKSTLTLFGGEPLLNPQGCINVLKKAQKIGGVYSTMITNGVLLRPKIVRKLVDANLQTIQISLDGDEKYHDITRINHAGKGSFQTIMHNSKYILENDFFPINFHINITMNNISSIIGLLEYLSDTFQTKNFGASFSYIGDTGIGFNNTIDSSQKTIFDLLAIRIKAYELGINTAIPTIGACDTCGKIGNRNSAVVSADGKLYSCWDAAGHENKEIGSVNQGFYTPEIIEKRWTRCTDGYKNKDSTYKNIMNHVDGYFLDYLKDNTTHFNEK